MDFGNLELQEHPFNESTKHALILDRFVDELDLLSIENSPYQIDHDNFAIVCEHLASWLDLYHTMKALDIDQPKGLKIIYAKNSEINIPNYKVTHSHVNMFFMNKYFIGRDISWLIFIIKHLLSAYEPSEVKHELNLIIGYNHTTPSRYVDVSEFMKTEKVKTDYIWAFNPQYRMIMEGSMNEIFVLLQTCIRSFYPEFPVNPMFFRYLCGKAVEKHVDKVTKDYIKSAREMRGLIHEMFPGAITYDWWVNMQPTAAGVLQLFHEYLG